MDIGNKKMQRGMSLSRSAGMSCIVAGLFLLCSAVTVQAQVLYTAFPDEINPQQHYVIYSHGLIVEGTDPRPEHPQYGVYEFALIKQALLRDADFTLIAHQRPANTDFSEYSRTLEQWVRALVMAGVRPGHITLLGFSRGGQLSAAAAHRLSDLPINTVLLAACMEADIPGGGTLRLSGKLLSVFETSDVMGSCSALAARSQPELSFEEFSITTGKTHGAFFQPLDAWLLPVKAWIADNYQN